MMRASETISKEMSARQSGLPRWYGLRGVGYLDLLSLV